MATKTKKENLLELPQADPNLTGFVDTDGRPYFFTEGKRKIHVRPVALDDMQLLTQGIEADYRKAGKPIDKPMIDVETAGGGKIRRELTATTLVVDNDPAETARRTALWNDHILAVEQMNTESNQIVVEYMLDGIDEPMPEDDGWLKRFRRWHFQIPDEPEERELFYKKHVLIKTPLDTINLQFEVMMVSASGTLDRKKMEAEKATFFRKIATQIQNVDINGTAEKASQEQVGT